MTLKTITFEQDVDLPNVKSLCAYVDQLALILSPEQKNPMLDTLQASHSQPSDPNAWTNWTVQSFQGQIQSDKDWANTKGFLQESTFNWVLYSGDKRTAYTPSIKYDAATQTYLWTHPVWSDASDTMQQVAPWLEAIAQVYRYPVSKFLHWMNHQTLQKVQTSDRPKKTWLKKEIPGHWKLVKNQVGPTSFIQALQWHIPKEQLQIIFDLWKTTNTTQAYGYVLQTASISQPWPNLLANLAHPKTSMDILHTLDQSKWHDVTGVVEFESGLIEASMPFFWHNESFEIRLVLEVDPLSPRHQDLIERLKVHVSLID